jgi:NAD-specific glutamate dehydrogenase
LEIERLKNDFDKWRRSFRIWQAAVIALLVVLIGLVGTVYWKTCHLQPTEVKAQLLATIEATYQKDLKEADSLTDWKRRDQARQAAVAWRDSQLAKLDAFVASISQTIAAGKASPEYVELTRVLQENGVDEALKYVAAQEPRLLDRAEKLIEARQQEVRVTLAPLLEKVRLLSTRGTRPPPDPSATSCWSSIRIGARPCTRSFSSSPRWGTTPSFTRPWRTR